MANKQRKFLNPRAKPSPRIVSVSRRTDIPAYYADWFMQQVERGYVTYPNPMSFKPVRLSLRPEDVLFIVFWTRNPRPIEKYLDRLDEIYRRAYYFHFTVNGLPKILETNNPPVEFAVATFRRLAERYRNQVFWRYDPIVLSDLTPPSYHIEKFGRLAERLRGATQRCYFSFVNWYLKVQRNFSKAARDNGVTFRDVELGERLDMVRQLQPIADANGMTLYSCCQDALCRTHPGGIDGVAKAHCVDIETIRAIAPERYRRLREAPTRQDCGCYESRDIGYYDSCPHGCIYCYANLNRDKAKAFYQDYLRRRALPMDEMALPPKTSFQNLRAGGTQFIKA